MELRIHEEVGQHELTLEEQHIQLQLEYRNHKDKHLYCQGQSDTVVAELRAGLKGLISQCKSLETRNGKLIHNHHIREKEIERLKKANKRLRVKLKDLRGNAA